MQSVSIQMSDSVQDFVAANPDKKVEVTIAVNPLLTDELEREHVSLPIIRIMGSKKFQSAAAKERYLAELLFSGSGTQRSGISDEFTTSDDAKGLVVEAFNAKDRSEREAKAQEALRLSPSCSEAYIVLADLEEESKRKIELLHKGIEIAATQLDNSMFENPDGYFWQRIITRPYMRCRTALAVALWESGEKKSAIDHLQTLLKLNLYDNQGLRFHLLNWLLDFDANDLRVDEYCGEYERDKSAFIKYACALWQFIRHGNGKASLKALSNAVESNKFLPALLCGRAEIPSLNITRVVRGSVQEAIAYQRTGVSAWRNADGALDWLASNCTSLLSSKTIIRKIESAEEYKLTGAWVGPAPIELSI